MEIDVSGLGFKPGEVAVVTGAGNGIGRATALMLAHAGVSIAAWDMDEGALDAVVKEIEVLGPRAYPMVSDLTDQIAVDEAWQRTAGIGLPVRYLVNNAGPAASTPMSVADGTRIAIGSYSSVANGFVETCGDGRGQHDIHSVDCGQLLCRGNSRLVSGCQGGYCWPHAASRGQISRPAAIERSGTRRYPDPAHGVCSARGTRTHREAADGPNGGAQRSGNANLLLAVSRGFVHQRRSGACRWRLHVDELMSAPWLFDADNHYYEAEDTFTRHGDADVKAYVRWVSEGRRRHLMFGTSISTSLPNPTFDPIAKPGVFQKRLQELESGGGDRVLSTTDKRRYGQLVPISPAYRDRDVRLEVMDTQGLDRCLLFPTLGVGVEGLMNRDVEMAYKVFNAFNRWLEEDWGFAHTSRLYAAPHIAMLDPELAAQELDAVLGRGRGARIVALRPGPANGRSPADPLWDSFGRE